MKPGCMRRTIKPFTVELRSGKRKPSPSTFPSDQPVVDWPAALLAGLQADPEPQKPAGRILPALDEAPAVPADEPDAPPQPLEARSPPVLEPEEPEPTMAASAPMAVEPEVEAALPTRGRARLARDAFGRGERWKARLPAVVHKKRRGMKPLRGLRS